jgi:hypothetical protein
MVLKRVFLVWVFLWIFGSSCFSHEGHKHSDEELEAVQFLLISATDRDAFLGQWLTDDLIDSMVLTDDGMPPGSRRLSESEIERLKSADLVFAAKENIAVPGGVTPKSLVRIEPDKHPSLKPSNPKQGRASGRQPLRPQVDICEGQSFWSTPEDVIGIASVLQHELGERIPSLKTRIERNFLFLKSELEIDQRKLVGVLGHLSGRKLLVPPCVFRSMRFLVQSPFEEVVWANNAVITPAMWQASCGISKVSNCVLVRSIPVGSGFSIPSGVIAGFMNAGLSHPPAGNYLGNLRLQIEQLDALLSLP